MAIVALLIRRIMVLIVPIKTLKFLCSKMKSNRVYVPVDGINNKKATKQKHFGKKEQPHPCFGCQIVPVYF